MALIGGILLGLVVLVAGVILALVATPLHLRFEAEAGETSRFVLEARTLWGLSPRLRLVDTDRPQAKKRQKKSTKKHTKKKKAKSWSPPGGRAAMWRLAKGLPEAFAGEVAKVHVDELDMEARFGTGDPADTGRLYGWLTPLVYALPNRRASLRLTPDFDRRCLQGHGAAALHLTPAALLGPVIRLLWTTYVRPT